MKTWLKVFFIALLFGVPAFFLDHVLWPPAAGSPAPTASQLPFFIILSALEAVLFGLGIAFIAFGLPVVRKVANGSKWRIGGQSGSLEQIDHDGPTELFAPDLMRERIAAVAFKCDVLWSMLDAIHHAQMDVK